MSNHEREGEQPNRRIEFEGKERKSQNKREESIDITRGHNERLKPLERGK